MNPEFVERFRSKVVEQDDGCWRWTGQVNTTSPYGRFYAGDLNERWVHRLAFRSFVGPIPDGLEIDHTCGFSFCVNPAHLEAVTHGENVRRAAARRKTPEHGTTASSWAGCRCDPCREAQRLWQRTYRAKLRDEAAAGIRPIPHGTGHGYRTFACRCDPCRKAATTETMAWRRKNGVRPRRVMQHGGTGMYSRGCRCDPCRNAWNAYWRSYRAARKAS